MSAYRIIEGDVRERLADLEEASVQTCITSPPYWGLRDYGEDDQLGLEATPEEYTANLVAVFREVRQVLRDDGTLWLNLGDSFGANKQLVGIPWRVAFALQADGWYLRSDIIWHKPNPMPESVTDRPTKSHEYLFLLAKSPRYYYDADAIREEVSPATVSRLRFVGSAATVDKSRRDAMPDMAKPPHPSGRNRRSVWTVTTKPFSGAHFAVFPPDLIEPCVLAGSAEGDTVLDPFTGSGTTGMVALRHGRDFVGTELNPEYAQMARDRIQSDAPLLNEAAA